MISQIKHALLKKLKAYWSQTFELYILIYTHRPPDGDAILIYISEVVGFKRMPVSEDDWSVIRPFKVICIAVSCRPIHNSSISKRQGDRIWNIAEISPNDIKILRLVAREYILNIYPHWQIVLFIKFNEV